MATAPLDHTEFPMTTMELLRKTARKLECAHQDCPRPSFQEFIVAVANLTHYDWGSTHFNAGYRKLLGWYEAAEKDGAIRVRKLRSDDSD